MVKAVIFDLDGTIIDSELIATQAIEVCMAQWKLPISKEDSSFVAGKKWEVAFDLLFSKYPMPVERKVASAQIVKTYQDLVRSDLQIVPGVVEAIRAFAKVVPMAVVSGSDREDVDWALNHLKVRNLFQHVLGAEDYPNSKPSPDGFLLGLKLMGVSPNDAVVFEDSGAGIAAGRAAGMKVVAITSTNHFHHDQSQAHHRIPNFLGIDQDWLLKLK